MRIRAVRQAELPLLRDIERAAGEGFRDIGMPQIADDDPLPLTTLAAYHQAGRAWVATDPTDVPVGYLIADVVDGNLHIEQVSVHPRRARRGIGRRLVDHLAAYATATGVPALTLTTFADVPWNAPYYTRCGFVTLHDSDLTPGCGPSVDAKPHTGWTAGPAFACAETCKRTCDERARPTNLDSSPVGGSMLGRVNGDLLPIGQFARLSRLSVKQLRHYDELGLLVPAHVDADSGYRYYRRDQAREALSIGLLRSLDVPLPVVAQVLAGTTGALEGVRETLDAELARRRRTLAALERVMAEGLPATPVRVVTEPARPVVMVRETAAGPADVARATSAAIARLLATTPFDGPPWLVGLFPIELADSFEVRAALAVNAGETLPGGTFASATHVGPYDQISLTAHAVLAWCAERGHPLRGPIREVYVSDPAVTAPEQLVTHLMIPLEDRP
ncbi:GNAT family N-acetyltransferase [Phytohabitans sp. LJ34]|uniref:GNAT family N-acetyltransferase n=1 Tax=Phytohabitans sp. LJ34 TaxID=3452217 RepID=UPI003F8930E8